MKNYLRFVKHIIENGEDSSDRTGVGTKSLFARTLRFHLQEGFPLCTTRKMYFQGIVDELLWMLSGSTNVNDLPERTRQIWDQDEWMYDEENGELGPSYGKQLRKIDDNHCGFKNEERIKKIVYHKSTFDQLKWVIHNIRSNPNSRRHVISLWQQPDMKHLALPCCHGIKIQFNVRNGEFLDCHMDARSQDVMIGMPWNIAFYSLLTHMVSNVTGYKPGKYIHTGGDCHIYKNHIEKAKKQLKHKPYEKPTLQINSNIEDIDNYDEEDIALTEYHHHSKIDYPIAV